MQGCADTCTKSAYYIENTTSLKFSTFFTNNSINVIFLITHAVNSLQRRDVGNERLERLVRRTTLHERDIGLLLEDSGVLSDVLTFLVDHDSSDGVGNLTSLPAVLEVDTDLENIGHVSGVEGLVEAKVGEDHGDTLADGLESGVPAGVGPEGTNGTVGQNFLLGDPLDNSASLTEETIGQGLNPGGALDKAGSDNPQEGLLGVNEASSNLEEVLLVDLGGGAEGNVEDGGRGLLVEPLKDGSVVVEQRRGGSGEVLGQGDEERGSGDLSDDSLELGLLELLEGVPDDTGGGLGLLDHLAENLLENLPVGVGGLDVLDLEHGETGSLLLESGLVIGVEVTELVKLGQRNVGVEVEQRGGHENESSQVERVGDGLGKVPQSIGDQTGDFLVLFGGEHEQLELSSELVSTVLVDDGDSHTSQRTVGGQVGDSLVLGVVVEDESESEVGVVGGLGLVEVGVEDGDGEALGVQNVGELQNGVDVALEGDGEENDSSSSSDGSLGLVLHCCRCTSWCNSGFGLNVEEGKGKRKRGKRGRRFKDSA